MSKYTIASNGCDATTVVEMELTDEELKMILRLANAITEKSTYQCEPTMSVYKGEARDNYNYYGDLEELTDAL